MEIVSVIPNCLLVYVCTEGLGTALGATLLLDHVCTHHSNYIYKLTRFSPQAIRDGVIEASIDHQQGFMRSKVGKEDFGHLLG